MAARERERERAERADKGGLEGGHRVVAAPPARGQQREAAEGVPL